MIRIRTTTICGNQTRESTADSQLFQIMAVRDAERVGFSSVPPTIPQTPGIPLNARLIPGALPSSAGKHELNPLIFTMLALLLCFGAL
jgi:hypothetical protein